KMALNMQQQITIAAWVITYANDCEAARRWRKRLLEMGSMQKIKPPGRPRISTDAETTKRIVEAMEKVYALKPQDVDILKLVVEEEIRAIPLD
ncbi:hypothetical protein L9F63_015978, partial [Diploptera punctata]